MRDNVAAGKKAKRKGKEFEDLFEWAARSVGIATTRMPDGCKQVGVNRNGTPMLQRVKTPMDWVLSYHSKTALIDTKSIDASTFPNSKIEEHQARELLTHEQQGHKAGYVVWLRESSSVIFIPASLLVRLINVRGSTKEGELAVLSLGKLVAAPVISGKIDFKPLFGRSGFREYVPPAKVERPRCFLTGIAPDAPDEQPEAGAGLSHAQVVGHESIGPDPELS